MTLFYWDWDFCLKCSFLFCWKDRLFTSFKASMCTFLLPCVIVCSHTLVHVSANAAHQLSYFQVHALLEDINCSKLTNKSFAHREEVINGGLSLNLSSSLCLIASRITHPLSWSPKPSFPSLPISALRCIAVMQHTLWPTQECPSGEHSDGPSLHKSQV